jgi:hypothetical protein
MRPKVTLCYHINTLVQYKYYAINTLSSIFYQVNRYIGLFFFDSGFRPVPLKTEYIGVKARGMWDKKAQMDDACFDAVRTRRPAPITLHCTRARVRIRLLSHVRLETSAHLAHALAHVCAGTHTHTLSLSLC